MPLQGTWMTPSVLSARNCDGWSRTGTGSPAESGRFPVQLGPLPDPQLPGAREVDKQSDAELALLSDQLLCLCCANIYTGWVSAASLLHCFNVIAGALHTPENKLYNSYPMQ